MDQKVLDKIFSSAYSLNVLPVEKAGEVMNELKQESFKN